MHGYTTDIMENTGEEVKNTIWKCIDKGHSVLRKSTGRRLVVT